MPGVDRIDPLGEQADPRCYVPLVTDERALAALVVSLEQRNSPVLLVGGSGIGKTILLRELARRTRRRGRRVVFSPFLHLPPEDVAGWLLHLLGKPVDGAASAEVALLELVQSPRARPLDVLVDEIQLSPPDSARLLKRLARAGGPGLAVVAAGTRGALLDALVPALQPETTVALPDALPEGEIEALCDALLRHPGVSGELRALAARERDTIVCRANGLPVLLKAELALRAHDLAVGRVRREPRPVARERPAVAVELPEKERPPAPAPRMHDVEAPVTPSVAARDSAPRAPARAKAELARSFAEWRTRLAPRPRAAVGWSARLAQRARAAAADSSKRLAEGARAAAVWRRSLAARAHEATGGTARVSVGELARLRAGATALRAHAPKALRPLAAAMLVSLALLSLPHGRPPPDTRHALVSAGPAPAASSPAARVRVHVNARPWARIRVDGVDVGPTPLGHLELPPGPHDFEAEFPDGRRLHRRIELGPERRSVTFP